jgi:hypothetical protein
MVGGTRSSQQPATNGCDTAVSSSSRNGRNRQLIVCEGKSEICDLRFAKGNLRFHVVSVNSPALAADFISLPALLVKAALLVAITVDAIATIGTITVDAIVTIGAVGAVDQRRRQPWDVFCATINSIYIVTIDLHREYLDNQNSSYYAPLEAAAPPADSQCHATTRACPPCPSRASAAARRVRPCFHQS